MQLVVGRIGRAHGIRGEVSVDVRTDDPELRFAPGSVLATDPPTAGPLTVRHARWHAGRMLVAFGDVEDRTAAEALRGTLLLVDAATSPAPGDPDEFWDHELLGLAAVDPAGHPLGEVADVLHLPGHDLLVVRRVDGGELLVPFVRAIVPEVDRRERRIVVDPPPGLLDLGAAGSSELGVSPMRIDIVTIFPEYFTVLDVALLGRARARGLLDVAVHDLRGWTSDVHRTVDDAPFGGGPGMVMRPEPWGAALDAVVPPEGSARLVVPTPSGRSFTQEYAAVLAQERWLVFACGRYEGIDARVVADAARRMPVDEVSIGDYVLAGGEAAVLVVVEAITRLLPGVLGNAASLVDDSFSPGTMTGLLEGPVYTRPAVWRGLDVPPVLRSGDHGAVRRWRRDEALRRTASRRPDLLYRFDPVRWDARDRTVLREALGEPAFAALERVWAERGGGSADRPASHRVRSGAQGVAE